MQDSERAQEAKCGLCGEPMPEGEEMFKFHGYSGGCPKPPLAEVAKYPGSMLAVDPPPSGASPQAETSANVRALTVHICEDCLNLRGEMCNEPGCRFCRRTMAEVAEYLDALLIRPRIDGVSVLIDEGTPLPSPVSPVEPTGASPFRLTDWIPTAGCDCEKCTAQREAEPPTGASPQAETSEDEDDVPAVDSWSAPLRKPVVPKILSTDDFYALLRILEVLPADPFLSALQAKLSDEERRQHGNQASHLSGPEFVREIERVEALIQSRVQPPALSPVEPEPPTLEPCAHELDYHNCAECVGLKVEPEPPICSDPHLLKRGCECASCLDPVRLKRQLLEVWEKYRAFVDAVASALHVESERGPVSEVSVIEAARDTLNQLLDSPTVEPEPPTEAQFGEYERLKRQAREIEKALREAGCPAMPLEQGVRWLADKDFTTPLPPRPPAVVKPHRYDLVRYGVTWEGQDNQPLLTPMPDGYWTPWHLAVEAPTVEPEPCAWRITSGPLGTWVNPTCVEGAIPAPWGTERAKACHLCGAPMKVEREP